MKHPLKIAISACLMGHKVRYDGGHKLDSLIIDTLGPMVELVPVCPEAECGLGVPRETMHLVAANSNVCLMTTETGRDQTAKLLSWSRDKLLELKAKNIEAFILKSRSPSCGIKSTKVFDTKGKVAAIGPGLFVRCLRESFPELVLAEEEDLHDIDFYDIFLKKLKIKSF